MITWAHPKRTNWYCTVMNDVDDKGMLCVYTMLGVYSLVNMTHVAMITVLKEGPKEKEQP
jgi:hypothetical protein